MTDFGKAGARVDYFGARNQFQRKVQTPWVYIFKSEPDMISLIEGILERFTNMESISMAGIHEARIIETKTGIPLDITILSDKIRVYPVTENHQHASETLYKILTKSFNGDLKKD